MTEMTCVPVAAVHEDELQTLTVSQSRSCTIVHPSDVTTVDQMNVVEVSGALDFWSDPEEDVYTESDGDAV